MPPLRGLGAAAVGTGAGVGTGFGCASVMIGATGAWPDVDVGVAAGVATPVGDSMFMLFSGLLRPFLGAEPGIRGPHGPKIDPPGGRYPASIVVGCASVVRDRTAQESR